MVFFLDEIWLHFNIVAVHWQNQLLDPSDIDVSIGRVSGISLKKIEKDLGASQENSLSVYISCRGKLYDFLKPSGHAIKVCRFSISLDITQDVATCLEVMIALSDKFPA